MNRAKWERFKFYALMALILTSLLQVGILWSNQNHGFPYYFFGNFLKDKESSNTKVVKDEFFSPYKIIVSEGQDETHWIIGKDNLLHNKLFNEVKLYLVEILRLDRIKSKQILELDDNILGELAGKYSVSVEFKAGISKELMAFFLDLKDISNDEISCIKKVVILPNADVNSNCTVEIIDEINKKIYEYVLPFQKLGMEDYKKHITELNADENLIDYELVKKLQITKLNGIQIRNDILFVASHSSKYNTYSTIDCYPPEGFGIRNTHDPDELKQELMNLADMVLKDQKDIYIPSKDIYGAAVFKNPDSVYRIYKDGLMEYSYFTPSKEEMNKGNIQDAYIRTLGFIINKEGLFSGAGLFLSGIEELKDRYRFTFDYAVEDLPVSISYQANDKEKSLLKNAVKIEATGGRVLNCWWIFREFKKRYDNQYNIYLETLLENLHDQHSNKDKSEVLDIKNIEIGYKVTREDFMRTEPIINKEPVWILETAGNNDPYIVTMRKK
jgi:hypothetical protein